MTQSLTWLDLSRLEKGTRVVFARPWDIFPECAVPEGAAATIKENGLNEIWCQILVEPEDEGIRTALRHWDGCIVLGTHLDPGANLQKHHEECTAEENEAANDWFAPSPLALAEAA